MLPRLDQVDTLTSIQKMSFHGWNFKGRIQILAWDEIKTEINKVSWLKRDAYAEIVRKRLLQATSTIGAFNKRSNIEIIRP
jgi:hypothetical protein